MQLALRYLLIFIAWMSGSAVAMDAYTLPAQLEHAELLPVLGVAVDERSEWSLREAMNASFNAPAQVRWGFLQKGQRLWTKTTIINPHPESITMVFDLGDHMPDNVTYYVIDSRTGEMLAQASAGNTLPTEKRAIKSHNIAFPLAVAANRSVDVYLCIQSRTRIQLAPALYSTTAFQHEERTYDVVTYLCYGGLISLILYHLIVLLHNHESESAYFIAVMVAWGAYSALLEGLLQPLWPTQWISYFRSDYQAAAAIFPVIALAGFTGKYLQQLHTFSHVRWILGGVCALITIAAINIFGEWLPFQLVRNVIIICLLIVAALLTFIFGVLALDGQKTARFYFVGALLMLLFMLNAAQIYVADTGLYTEANIWLRLSFIAPLLFFAAGHGYRINELRLQHEASAQRVALALNEAKFKSSFLATMSHEIRSPMNGVLAPVELLNMTPLTKEQATYVDIIAKSSNALMSVVNDILDYSQLEAGKLTLSVSTFSLRELIAECLALFSVHPKRQTVHLSADIPANMIDSVEGDAHRLRQVLFNLIGNAFKFTDHGRIQLTVREVEKISAGENVFEFSVSDSGVGISAEDLPKLFSEYQQVGAAHHKIAGTGLGLVICKQLVELMGGEISVRSQLGVGSTFSFRAPLRVEVLPPARPLP